MSTHLATKRAPSLDSAFDHGFAGIDARLNARSQTRALPVSDYPRSTGTLEISVRGRWVPVPSVYSHGYILVITGSWLKMAAVHDEDWLAHEFTDPQPCLDSLLALAPKDRPDIFSFTQKVPDTNPRYAFPMELDSAAVVSFDSFDQWWNALPRETRKNVRRAQKRGVEITTHEFNDDLVTAIAAIQNECSIRQGRRYQHYGKSLDQVRRDHSSFTERCDFITARFQNEIIGFLKLVHRDSVSSIMQLNSLMAHYDKRPANALLAKAVELCAARGISHLTYGKYNYGNKDDSGLREFKSRHAFRNLAMPRYYVPLTAWGNLCVRNRLYRDLHQILPSSVIKAALDLRAKWYTLTAK